MDESRKEKEIYDNISASFQKRLLAWLIDQALLGGLLLILLYLTNSESFYEFVMNSPGTIIQYIILIHLPYFTFLEGYHGQTLGKRVLNIWVYRGDGSPTTFSAALLRRIGLEIPVFGIIDGLAILFTDKNQRIFDVIAGTYVLKGDEIEKTVKYLKGEIKWENLSEEIRSKPKSERVERKEKMLDRIKEEKEKLNERLKSGDIEKEEHKKLSSKYESRIRELEKEIKIESKNN